MTSYPRVHRHLGLVMCAGWIVALAPGRASAQPAPPIMPAPVVDADGLVRVDPATLKWGTDVRSVELRKTSHLSLRPASDAPLMGKIVAGTHAGFTRLVAGEAPKPKKGRKPGKIRCPVWVELQPAGFVCADRLAASTQAPGGDALPVVPPGALTPEDYFKVNDDGVQAYATPEDITNNVPAVELNPHVMVKPGKHLEVDGTDYVKTHAGWVAADELSKMSPSKWVGIDLKKAPPASWPFAFVMPFSGDATVALRETPDKKAKVIDKLARRSVVAVGEQSGNYVQVDGRGWVDDQQLRIIRKQARPASVAAGAPWIDVDMEQQTLVAYEGDTPVYATLVSTARIKKNTPAATYRMRSKAASTRMTAEKWEATQYDIGEVPWALRFKKGLFLHAAYWHDNFGNRQSHGCVNLSPRDARFLYDWTTPAMPVGWSEREIPLAEGMIIRIRDADHPDPPLFDYGPEMKSKYTADVVDDEE